jgi:hypothetical protein
MSDTDSQVDLSVSPERMLWIRDHVRELVVHHIHALLIVSRALRRAGMDDQARRCEVQARRLTKIVGTLDNPRSMLTFAIEDYGEGAAKG